MTIRRNALSPAGNLRDGIGRERPTVLQDEVAELAHTERRRKTTTDVSAGGRLYGPARTMWPGAGSNRRPSDFQSDARTN